MCRALSRVVSAAQAKQSGSSQQVNDHSVEGEAEADGAVPHVHIE